MIDEVVPNILCSSEKMFISTLQGVNVDCEIATYSTVLAFGILEMFAFLSCKPSFSGR